MISPKTISRVLSISYAGGQSSIQLGLTGHRSLRPAETVNERLRQVVEEQCAQPSSNKQPNRGTVQSFDSIRIQQW